MFTTEELLHHALSVGYIDPFFNRVYATSCFYLPAPADDLFKALGKIYSTWEELTLGSAVGGIGPAKTQQIYNFISKY